MKSASYQFYPQAVPGNKHIIYMGAYQSDSLKDYSLTTAHKAGEVESARLLQEYQSKEFPPWKVGAVLAYAFLGMYSIGSYMNHIKKTYVKTAQTECTGLGKLIKNASKHGVAMSVLFLLGGYALFNSITSRAHIRRYMSLKVANQSYVVRFDPRFQEEILFREMRSEGFPESFIDRAREEIKTEFQFLSKNNQLTEETLTKFSKQNPEFSALGTWLVRNVG